MTIKGGDHRYGGVAIGFHWIAAAAIPPLILLGFAAAYAGTPGQQARAVRIHVVLGLAVLLLTVLRAAWWRRDRRPVAVDQPAWRQRLSRIVHVLLYAVPLLVAVSGIGLMILSKAAPVLFFGAPGPLPRFADFPPMTVHAVAAFSLIALIGLHVGAALYHHFGRRDRLLARMGFGR